MHVLNINVGIELVKAARASIELYLKNPNFDKKLVLDSLKGKEFDEMQGIFVTLFHYPTNTLRGCIGFPEPITTLKESVIDAALAAAFDDPRFVPVSHKELDELVIEVSVLTNPIKMHRDWRRRQNSVVIGKDGLIVEYGLYKGLLLPDVATEYNFTPKKFLEEVCIKANIPKEYWKQPKVKIYKFETQIFKEEAPCGEITKVSLLKMGS